MFEKYKDIQQEFYDLIYKSVVINKKISHAYLIDSFGYSDTNQLVLSFAKLLLCTEHKVNDVNCGECNLCELIDKGIDEHIKIIKPVDNSSWIKKEQLLQLKEEFSKKTLDGLPKIYIIEEAEKLNASAANSLLKFIEEPEEGIIAILVSNNRYKILPTILSRCQIYSLKKDKDDVDMPEYQDLFDFIMNLERNKEQTICYINDLWNSKYKTKEEFVDNFTKLENILLDLIDYKVNRITKFSDYIDDINYIDSKNSEQSLVHKLTVISNCKEMIQYNANLSLLMDKFIIEYVGGELV